MDVYTSDVCKISVARNCTPVRRDGYQADSVTMKSTTQTQGVICPEESEESQSPGLQRERAASAGWFPQMAAKGSAGVCCEATDDANSFS